MDIFKYILLFWRNGWENDLLEHFLFPEQFHAVIVPESEISDNEAKTVFFFFQLEMKW